MSMRGLCLIAAGVILGVLGTLLVLDRGGALVSNDEELGPSPCEELRVGASHPAKRASTGDRTPRSGAGREVALRAREQRPAGAVAPRNRSAVVSLVEDLQETLQFENPVVSSDVDCSEPPCVLRMTFRQESTDPAAIHLDFLALRNGLAAEWGVPTDALQGLGETADDRVSWYLWELPTDIDLERRALMEESARRRVRQQGEEGKRAGARVP